ncbi:MAG: transporter substrate-binding domain-containing protein [Acidimicrobiia bacterium]|nr:transporter substrate-binding domain-containing protein [Acidimicrobiia bacterium]MDX2466794.1 transporter substrate-binding domain-containing protein [Acidimicrobiia bacterium]
MIKRLLVLLAVLALVAAACGGTSDSEESTTTTAADGTTETTAATDSGGDAGQGTEGGILAAVQARGNLICGVNNGVPGFGFVDDAGSFSGFDVDYCRAIAAAVLGDSEAVQFRVVEAADRGTVIQTGEVDVLIRNTTWTQSRDAQWGGDFGVTTFYDGQGFMGLQSAGITAESGPEVWEGAVVCTIQGTTSELNATNLAAVSGVTIDLVTYADADGFMNALQSGQCDIATTDKSQLASRKATASPAEFSADLIIPGYTFSKEPLGPVYQANDSQWGDVVNWTVFASLIAEEKGITSTTLESYLAANPDDTEAARLFGGADDQLQGDMGLDALAFANVITQVGNYAEIYERNLGPDTPFNLPRGLNELWTQGGLLYPPPAR